MSEEERRIIDRAVFFYNTGRYPEAMKELLQLLAQYPGSAIGLAYLGLCKVSLGEDRQGIEDLRRAVSLQPDHSYLYYLLARGYDKVSHYDAAHDAIQVALSHRPDNDSYLALLAHILIFLKRSGQARETASRALAINPQNEMALNVRSLTLFTLDQTQEQETTILSALNVNPLNDFQHYLLGRKRLQEGDALAALEAFREVLRLDPNDKAAKSGLVQAIKARYWVYRQYAKFSEWRDASGSVQMNGIDLLFWVALVGAFYSLISSEPMARVLGFVAILPFILLAIVDPIANLCLGVNDYGRYALDQQQRWVRRTTATGLIMAAMGLIVLIFNYHGGISLIFLGLEIVGLFGGVYHYTVTKPTAAIITCAVTTLVTAFAAARVLLHLDNDLSIVDVFGLVAIAISYYMVKRAE
jgi:tetratricopeptide (TPR) repeat protein